MAATAAAFATPLVMARAPVERSNAGIIRVGRPGAGAGRVPTAAAAAPDPTSELRAALRHIKAARPATGLGAVAKFRKMLKYEGDARMLQFRIRGRGG